MLQIKPVLTLRFTLIKVRFTLMVRVIFAPLIAVAFLAGCSGAGSAQGTLTGHLYGVGGPAPGLPRPWPGTVTLTGPSGQRELSVGADGSYSVIVPADRYTVVGRSPLYESNAALCQAAAAVTVTSGHTAKADVWCQMM